MQAITQTCGGVKGLILFAAGLSFIAGGIAIQLIIPQQREWVLHTHGKNAEPAAPAGTTIAAVMSIMGVKVSAIERCQPQQKKIPVLK
jgi:hypothetical protein